MNMDKEVWEGWTVSDFVNEISPIIKFKTFKDRAELKKWCMSEQPYYKKYIPEVVDYFDSRVNYTGRTL